MRSFAVALALCSCTVAVPPSGVACDGSVRIGRGPGGATPIEDCARTGQRCVLGACTGCVTGQVRCAGDAVERCVDGLTWALEDACDAPAEVCAGGACTNACEAARSEASYLGCELHAVPLLNSLLADGFELGVVLASPWDEPVAVRIERGELSRELVLAPGATETVRLPFVPELRTSRGSSTWLADGGYTVRADHPIAAYQYDPLEFRLRPDCRYTGTSADFGCFSFTNDASLILPDHAVGTEYLIDTRGGRSAAGASFVAIVAIEEVAVTVRASAALLGTDDGRLAPWPADAERTVTLAAGDVLQLVSVEGDLAGTEVRADRPVLVFAGHDCANVPEAFGACDHLEEVMLPTDSWGSTAVVAVPRSVPGEPIVVRITSAVDGNQIHLGDRSFTLDRGRPFELLTEDDLVVEGSGPLLVTEYMVGAALFDRGGQRGDPSMGVAPFVEQFRDRYDFAVPATFSDDFVAIVAPQAGEVRLDGAPIEDWDPLPPFRVARLRVTPGPHRIDASHGAGLTSYGVAPFTSYLLPGGLDVEPLR